MTPRDLAAWGPLYQQARLGDLWLTRQMVLILLSHNVVELSQLIQGIGRATWSAIPFKATSTATGAILFHS